METVKNCGLNEAGAAENDPDDVEFAYEEAARPPMEKSPKSSAVSKPETMAQKDVEEFERFKVSTEAKMKIRQRKMNRLEAAVQQEAAKAADYAAKLVKAKRDAESNASKLVEVVQSQEALQTKVAELTKELGRLQDKKPSADAASDDDDDDEEE